MHGYSGHLGRQARTDGAPRARGHNQITPRAAESLAFEPLTQEETE